MPDSRANRGRSRGKSGPPRARPKVDPARRAAHDVLRAVRVDEAYTNLVLPHVLAERKLFGRDAAFVTELASGTLRRRGTYDAILAACLDRPLGKVDPKALDCLRLGAHQLLSMRVPAHAAISTTVDLARDRAGHGAGGFVNAVLRRVSEQDLETWIDQVAPDPATDPVGHGAIAHSHPRWVVESFAAALAESASVTCESASIDGESASVTRESASFDGELGELLAADNEPPKVVLVARPGRVERDELPGEATALSPYGVVLDGGDPGDIRAVAQGRAGVQDEGSQLVALALSRADVDGSDDRWLDLCAGPGGKSALLAGLASETGARLLANEAQPHRAGLVAKNLTGAEGVLGVIAADGTKPAWRPGTFDRVLVDAPCTGLGALRRRPEARWRRTPGDIDSLVPLQKSLLTSALDATRPGGVVLYATCSPVLVETRGVIEAVLAKRDDVELGDLAPLFPDVTDAAGPLPGTLQLWPHRHRTDAMFMALLRRSN